MKLTIYRGAKEIGGSCIELQSGQARLLMDFGLPLVDENKVQLDSREIKKQTQKALLQKGILPVIKGLYKDEPPLFDAILISHPHQDHYGLLSYVNPRVPVYMSRGCRALLEVSAFFNQTDYALENVITLPPWKSLTIADFKIKPYLVDHSGFDAFAYLIENEDTKVLYSGDFRGHGKRNSL